MRCNHRFSTQLFHVWDRCVVSPSIWETMDKLEAILLKQSNSPVGSTYLRWHIIECGMSKIGFHFKRSWFGIAVHHSNRTMLPEVWSHALLSFGNRSEGRQGCWFLRVVSLPKIGVVSHQVKNTLNTFDDLCIFISVPVWVALVHLWWTCT